MKKLYLALIIIASELILGGNSLQQQHYVDTRTIECNFTTSNNYSLLFNNFSSSEEHEQLPEVEALSTYFKSNGALVDPTSSDHSGSRSRGLDLQVKLDIFNEDQMKLLYKLYTNVDQFHGKMTVPELGFNVMLARSHSLTYDDMMMHRYDSYTELKQSTGPHINQELCLSQLTQLNRRLDGLKRKNSTDINLFKLLDTYGQVSSGVMGGGVISTGMYNACLRTKINYGKTGERPTRYCLASIKSSDWPKDNKLDTLLNFKAGVCLPQACDSQRYKNKYELIQQLMNFNSRELDKNKSTLNNLYCLPDKDSPLRMWWRAPKTLLAVMVFSIWIGFLIYATIKYELSKRSAAREENDTDKLTNKSNFGLTSGLKLEDEGKEKKASIGDNLKLYRMLAITNNFESLFGMSRKRSEDNLIMEATSKPIIDLACLEGIKVICMCYVIIGHVVLGLTTIITNGQEVGFASSPAFILSNMLPAFAVNAFFTITGMLTCYLMFKQNAAHSFMTSPLKWVAFMTYRYLRIMPIYLVVVFYCKYISKFTGSGPMWDYGTSSLAHRHRCEEESWLSVIFFGANFKHVFDQCIPSAWYLANDFQFFLVTPIFLVALYKSPQFGQRLLKFCIAAGYLAGIISMISTEITDIKPIMQFLPHGFMTYLTFFSPSYTRPYYRIPAYLCGLLLGYYLHTYEQDKLKCRSVDEERDTQVTEFREEPDWPKWFLKYGIWISFSFIIMCGFLPVIGSHLPDNKFSLVAVAIIMSSYHIMFAMGVGLYILLATTGHGNRSLNHFLSASIWKPLAKLNLCILLINIEAVKYIVQSGTQHIYLDFFSHSAYNLLGIVFTYLVAVVVFILFEMPLKSVLNHFFTLAMSKFSTKKKLN